MLYKVTSLDGSSCHGGKGRWTLGRWRSVRSPLVACENGLHLCTIEQLPGWLGPAIWEAETDGKVLDAGDKVVARRARIIRRVETWNERTARLYAADCAEHVLHLFEARYPADDRPRRAIEVARRYANGQATAEELAAAAAAAEWAAVWASRSAARAAAWAAAAAAEWEAVWEAGAAEGRVERAWQAERLAAYLDGRLS